ncbi:hypothetical protein V2J09_023381 [Rumex salicifolius]
MEVPWLLIEVDKRSFVRQRKKECPLIGYEAPKVPKARRSVRKRSLCKETIDDGKLCAFELLAAVAGKLLQESDSSSASSNAAVVVDNHNISGQLYKEEPQRNVNEAISTEREYQGSSEESGVSSSVCLRKCTPKVSNKEAAVDALDGAVLKQISAVSDYSSSAKMGFDVKPIIVHRSENECKYPSSETDGGSPKCGESFGPYVDSASEKGGPCQDVNRGTGEVLGIPDKFSSKGLVESCGKLSPPIYSGDKADLMPFRGSAYDASFSKHTNDNNVDGRDDDDILSHLSDPCSQKKAYGSAKYVADRQIRKLLTSKKWESAPKLKDCRPNSGSKRNCIYPNGKSCCDHEKFQHSTPFKKRKLVDQSSNLDCQQSSNSTTPHVKLSIKSFTVPELLLEVPESTTVGSLKETVMDAITAVLGGGLHVGVLLHGNRIHDDSRTLLQTGISDNDNNLDDLGFILEPCSSTQLRPNPPPEDPLSLSTCHLPKDSVNRPLNSAQELSLIDTTDKTPVTDPGKLCQALVPFSAPKIENEPLSDSKALVPVPEILESLAVVPVTTKVRCSEIGQRRTRRPFTVSEVEALVEAVEKLGTGRWRDVKLCAFENAKHRTYVDLKDKWKTLVHTARISPQQRRGEPVPQELLDRVLAAHANWSHHQTKHQPLQLKVAAA